VLVVSDAGPLIAFFDADAIGVLFMCYPEIIIPPLVHQEVFLRRKRAKPRSIKIHDIDFPEALKRFAQLRKRLDGGEAQALALAEQRGLTVLIDEKAGSRIAEELKISYVSTVDVLAQLVNTRKLKAAKADEIVRIMRFNGTHMPETRFSK
jgi:predicted nucleic acid-binding protein